MRNLSIAAKRIGISQSAASHAVAKLRAQVGDPLFVRTSGGVRLTPYGERLGSAARQALDILAAGLATDHVFDPRVTARQFNVYLSEIGQMVFLPKLLSVLQNEAPAASLRACPIPLDSPGAALASGEVDLAVGFFTNLTAGFHQSFLFREWYVCVVRSDHPNFRSGMTMEAFLASPHALADSSGMAHAVLDGVLAKHRIHRNVKLRVPDFVVLPLVIANSDLLVIMPSRLAKAFSLLVSIKELPMPVSFPPYEIRVYWHERYHQDVANRWLRRRFVELFRS